MALMSWGSTFSFSSLAQVSSMQATTVLSISRGSCSTQPSSGCRVWGKHTYYSFLFTFIFLQQKVVLWIVDIFLRIQIHST